MSPENLIGSLEASRILGCDRATFNRWCAAGKIHAYVKAPSKVGARLFLRDDIEALARDRGIITDSVAS